MKKFFVKTLVPAVMAVAMVGALGACETVQEKPKDKVVYHINYKGGEKDKMYMAAMGNIRNHIKAVGADNVDIKVVMHGDGLEILKAAKANVKLQDRIKGLKAEQIGFSVCKNTLVGRKIDYKKDLYDVDERDIVPSGVA